MIKPNFLHVTRIILLVSVLLIISEISGVAATIHNSTLSTVTTVAIADEMSQVTPILVKNYLSMLQFLASKNEDHKFYDIHSMSNQILCNIDDQGDRTYQVVENEGEQPMQGLTSNDENRYYWWLNDQRQENQENSPYIVGSTHKVSVTAKNSGDSETALLFTPDQVNNIKKVNQTLGVFTYNSLTNDVFEHKAILAAIMSYLASLGLSQSSDSINTIANVLGKSAATLTVIALVPIIAEHIGHRLEGRIRHQVVKEGWCNLRNDECILKTDAVILIQQEAKNKRNTDALKHIKHANGKTPVMVYGYFSPMGEKLSRFATNWRNGWSPFFKMMGMNIATDELHLSFNRMQEGDIKIALSQQEEDATKVTNLLRTLQKSPLDFAPSVIERSLYHEENILQNLQAQQQNCLLRGLRYITDNIADFVARKLAATDEWWKNYQIQLRNGDVQLDERDDNSTISMLEFEENEDEGFYGRMHYSEAEGLLHQQNQRNEHRYLNSNDISGRGYNNRRTSSRRQIVSGRIGEFNPNILW